MLILSPRKRAFEDCLIWEEVTNVLDNHDLCFVTNDGDFFDDNGLGHLPNVLAFGQPDRNPTLHRCQPQGPGHQVGVDPTLAPRFYTWGWTRTRLYGWY